MDVGFRIWGVQTRLRAGGALVCNDLRFVRQERVEQTMASAILLEIF